jgi:glycine/D-amino acid oxidase-like deaminating enzyme
MNKQVDYIIAGRGIAGTVLAQTLMNRRKTVMIIDEPSLSSASKIAAGLYNPVVFKRLVKSWMADELIPVMDDFYHDCEQLLNEQFYFKKQIVKLFTEENEKAFWLKKTTEDVGKYLSNVIHDEFLPGIVHNPLGASEVIAAGNLDTTKFLDAFKKYFQKHNCLAEEKFEHAQLAVSENSVSYKGITAGKIIFCEGYRATENPYFNNLPFKLTKGEILTIKLPGDAIIPVEKVINKGVFILPLGNNIFKAGATYEWNELTEEPTEKGRIELSEKLQKVLGVPFEIIDHRAGIRPTVSDRRPLLGFHPQHPALAVFNGMGTKGVMLAPYFAKHFADVLENKIPLNKEVDIARFLK